MVIPKLSGPVMRDTCTPIGLPKKTTDFSLFGSGLGWSEDK